MLFSFLKKKNFKELETISEYRATQKAAKELGIKISYKESKENHILPKEHFQIIIVDLKEVSNEKKIKFEELQQEYQEKEYHKLLKDVVQKTIIYTGLLIAGASTLSLATCLQQKENHPPKLIQKASTHKGYNYPYSHAREK